MIQDKTTLSILRAIWKRKIKSVNLRGAISIQMPILLMFHQSRIALLSIELTMMKVMHLKHLGCPCKPNHKIQKILYKIPDFQAIQEETAEPEDNSKWRWKIHLKDLVSFRQVILYKSLKHTLKSWIKLLQCSRILTNNSKRAYNK